MNLKLKFWNCNDKNKGFYLTKKRKKTTSGWALEHKAQGGKLEQFTGRAIFNNKLK